MNTFFLIGLTQEVVIMHWACSKITASLAIPDAALLETLLDKVIHLSYYREGNKIYYLLFQLLKSFCFTNKKNDCFPFSWYYAKEYHMPQLLLMLIKVVVGSWLPCLLNMNHAPRNRSLFYFYLYIVWWIKWVSKWNFLFLSQKNNFSISQVHLNRHRLKQSCEK